MNRPRVEPASRRLLSLVIGAAVLCSPLAITGRATAQDSAKAAAKAPAPDDKVILPFISSDTVIVGRFDVSRLDMKAVEAYANKMFDEMAKELGGDADNEGDDEIEELPAILADEKKEMAASMNEFRQKLAEFTGAGGHHVYILIESGGFSGDGAPVLITPLGVGADPAKLEEMLAEMAFWDATTTQVAGTLVTGQEEGLDALKQRVGAAGDKPAAAAAGTGGADLAKAFAAAGADAPFRLALVPGEAARKLLEEQSPTLPEELGGGDVKLVSRGVRWATLSISQKPAIGINLTIQASDAEHAKGLMELLAKAIGELKAQLGEEVPRAAKYLAALKPKLQGETITLTIDPALLQMGMLGAATAEIDADDDAEPAKPAKPDDGGL